VQIDIFVTEVGPSEPKGKYSTIPVHYQDRGEEKVKLIYSFQDISSKITQDLTGKQCRVTLEKNKKGFWEWTAIEVLDGTPASDDLQNVPTKQAPARRDVTSVPRKEYVPMKDTRETPEERNARQVLIVRQSSLAQAVAYTEATKATNTTPDELLDLAEAFTGWVFGNRPTVIETFKVADDSVKVADSTGADSGGKTVSRRGRPKKVKTEAVPEGQEDFPFN
jgi:hypothetical protein